MRRAINNISIRKGQSVAFEICTALRQLQSSFQRIYIPTPETQEDSQQTCNTKLKS